VEQKAEVTSKYLASQSWIFLRQYLPNENAIPSDDSSCKRAVAGGLVDRVIEEQSANTFNTGPYCKARQRLPLKQTQRRRNHGSPTVPPDTMNNQADSPQLDSQKSGLGLLSDCPYVVLISLAADTVIGYSLAAYQGKGTVGY
jgi:hypothetical protein